MGRRRIYRTEEELAELRHKQREYHRLWSKNRQITQQERERRCEKLRLRYRNDEQWAESRRAYQREKWRRDNGYYERHPDKLKHNENGTDIELQGRIPELVSRN